MTAKTKKATFNLPAEILRELDLAMAEGKASSKNALVAQALIKELKELRRQARKALWQEAAHDRLFQKDISDVETAFDSADAETAGRIG